MKSDQVIAAMEALLKGDREHGLSVIHQMEAAERNAGRLRVAERLRRLRGNGRPMLRLPNAPKHIGFCEPTVVLESVVLSSDASTVIKDLLTEWECRDALLAHDLLPRFTLLLYGPSGNGKTFLANAIANALDLPLGIVDYGSLIDSYRGVTGKSIMETMNFAQTTPCVLFFDEADSILGSRGTGTRGSEVEDRRAVNQILMQIDKASATSLLVFATNFVDAMDAAWRRRMEVCIEMGPPSEGQRRSFVWKIASRWPFLDSPALCREAEAVGSFAECEAIVMLAARAAVVHRHQTERKEDANENSMD